MSTAEISVIVSGAIAFTSLLVTAYQAHQTRQHDARESEQTRLHERAMEVDRRRQQRTADLYLDVTKHLVLFDLWVRRTNPMISSSSDPDRPATPAENEVMDLQARTDTFGSPEVQALLLEWSESLRQFQIAATAVEADTPDVDAWKVLGERRVAVFPASRAVRERINLELAQ